MNMYSDRVRTGFEKLWKLKMPFSRTWKVLEKREDFQMAMEKCWIFVWNNSKISYNGCGLVSY